MTTPISKRIGVLGTGQLGRMLAIAGYPLGQKFAFYGNDKTAPSALLGHMVEPGDDTDSLQELAETVDVITYETENTDPALITSLQRTCDVYPSIQSLITAQHRGREKNLFTQLGIATADYEIVTNFDDCQAAVSRIGCPVILKTTTEGYDGKGQARVNTTDELSSAWKSLQADEVIVEQMVPFDGEISCIGVRNRHNQMCVYPLTLNVHHKGILRYSIAPALGFTHLQAQAETMLKDLMQAMDHVGILALELFVVGDQLLANEMAPRVHNSGHWTIEGTPVCQFENHIRAITHLPLGNTHMTQNLALMINIIGEHGDLHRLLSDPQIHCHLYDKEERPGRKIGHFTLCVSDANALCQHWSIIRQYVPDACHESLKQQLFATCLPERKASSKNH